MARGFFSGLLDEVEIARVLQQLGLEHIVKGNGVIGVGSDHRMPANVVRSIQ